MSDYKIILFYKFVDIAKPEELRDSQRELCSRLGLTGRLLIGEEGINGTFEGKPEAIKAYQETLREDPRFSDILFKESDGTGEAFTKLKIKVRPEIVTLRAGRFNVKAETAPEITIDELRELYEHDDDFVVLDLRNDYEIKSGAFDKTIDPGLENFRDLPEKLKELDHLKDKKVVTVCTGGIRCEKATCLMRREGFKNIYQLKDGIHTYMVKYPGKDFKGSLFVFDNRMTTDVVPTINKEIIGKCEYCGVSCEQYYSDDSVRPSKKVICCDQCYEANKERLRQAVEFKQEVKN